MSRPVSPAVARRRLLAQLAPGQVTAPLFDHLSDVYLFVKDRQSRFVMINRAFMTLLGTRREEDVLGRTDADFFPRDMAETFRRGDEQVFRTGEPLLDKVELLRNPDGSIEWYHTTKLPLRDRRGAIVGLAGFTRDLKKMKSANERFLSMAPVIDTIMNEYAGPLAIAALAKKVRLSVSQFERQFKKRFGTSPLKYITEIRLGAACQLLSGTDLPMARVAQQTGFYDQSHLAHQFMRHKGMTPSRYREIYASKTDVMVPAARPE